MAEKKENNTTKTIKVKDLRKLLRIRQAHHAFNNFIWSKIGGIGNIERFQASGKVEHKLQLSGIFQAIDQSLEASGSKPLSEEEKGQIVNIVFRSSFQLDKNAKDGYFIIMRNNEITNYNNLAIRYTVPNVPEKSNLTFLNAQASDAFSALLEAMKEDSDDES